MSMTPDNARVADLSIRIGGNLVVQRKAIFSVCGLYRYLLRISFDQSLPAINFLMLNPSTADEMRDDPTVAKCRHWAIAWGFGSVVVTNLFAFRATDPREMKAHPVPIGPLNDVFITTAAAESLSVVCAWGQHGTHRNRAAEVYQMISGIRQKRGLSMLKITSGEPWHPLYLRNDLKPQRYERANR